MGTRLQLQAYLASIPGVAGVYFQPPATIKMKYPAIVYNLNDIYNRHADNSIYNQKDEYSITVIDRNPDSTIVRAVSLIPTCRYNRHFASDGLNHDVFTIHY